MDNSTKMNRLKNLFSLKFDEDLLEKCMKEFQESGQTPEQWVEVYDEKFQEEMIRFYSGKRGICECGHAGEWKIEWTPRMFFDGIKRCVCPCGKILEETPFME